MIEGFICRELGRDVMGDMVPPRGRSKSVEDRNAAKIEENRRNNGWL